MIKRLLIIIFIGLLLISPVSAKEVVTKVDDKGLLISHTGVALGTLHTPYGWIIVNDPEYNMIMVNDTIKYNTNKDTFWSIYWNVEVIK